MALLTLDGVHACVCGGVDQLLCNLHVALMVLTNLCDDVGLPCGDGFGDVADGHAPRHRTRGYQPVDRRSLT